jgi:hypothetical protein
MKFKSHRQRKKVMSKIKDNVEEVHFGEGDVSTYPDEEGYESTAICLECKKQFRQERDLQLCDNCIDKFDTDKLWKLHDQNKLDALDFNENSKLREQFRIKKQ